MSAQSLILIDAILLGLVFGSFLNVCIYRIPLGMGLGGRSLCPHCKALIAWYDNIPVLSFLILGTKCRKCKGPIRFRYPLVEILTAILSLTTLYREGFVFSHYLLWFFLFICPLIAITFTDIDHRVIPDMMSLPSIITGIIATLYFRWPDWENALFHSGGGILLGGGLLLLLSQLYFLIRKREGMGGGDIKLCAMLGAFLGWQGMVFVFFLSSILALLYGIITLMTQRKTKEPLVIPYGPFLSGAALIYYFYGSAILAFYFSLLGRPLVPITL